MKNPSLRFLPPLFPGAVILLFLLAPSLPISCPAASADEIRVDVHPDRPISGPGDLLTGVCLEDVNHEIYGGLFSQLLFGESFQEPPANPAQALGKISGMWRPILHGSAVASFALDTQRPFVGSQSQQMTFQSGQGDVAIQNRGLNGWGISILAGKSYEGCAWVRAAAPTRLLATLQSADGATIYSQQSLQVPAGNWTRLDFSLTPSATDTAGAFALVLPQPGSVTVGYAFLQPGPWGLFKGLPVRKDLALGLIDQGIGILRYGGSMVNSPRYRWKKMIGPRDRRPPYDGHWYPYSSNGWGVIDFLNLCEAANLVGVPDLNLDESPSDIADFIEYVNGSPDSSWGGRRSADGHPAPYHLKYLELGNEQRVDGACAAKFNAIAKVVWAKDPAIILVMGDFSFKQRITDPDHITGADSGIQNLDGQRQILDFARRHNREVWFDVHVWSENLQPSPDLLALPSYIDAIDRLAAGARHRVVVFELNANSHGLNRALANAVSIGTIRRDHRIAAVCSANALQPDGQNDNGWDQGLLFFNPSQAWLQPPAYVLRILADNNLLRFVQCDVSPGSNLDVTALRSEDGKTLVLQIVNTGPAEAADISLRPFMPAALSAQVTELTGPDNAANTAASPDRVQPHRTRWDLQFSDGILRRVFPADSFTVIRFE